MKIYAIRDKLLDYFMPPFVAPSDNTVKASMANLVSGDTQDAITQAPHHFEIWSLAEVEEDGHIKENRQVIAQARDLVRARRETTRSDPNATQRKADENETQPPDPRIESAA